MFDQSIIEQIINYWNHHQNRPNAGIIHKSAPIPDHIRKIIETVYNASLKKEEGISIRVRVSLFDADLIRKIREDNNNLFLLFENELTLDVDTLAKVALSFDPITTSIAVLPSTELPDELTIIGAVFSSKKGRNKLESLPEYLPPPDVFTVATKESGYLVISRGGSIICHFKDGKFYPPIPTPFHSRALGRYMHQIVESHPEFAIYQNRYWHFYVDTMSLLLTESLNRGHGGTIIWLPQESLSMSKKIITPKYSIRSDFLPQLNHLKELLQWEDENDKMYDFLQKSECVKSGNCIHLNATTILMLKAKRKLRDYIEFLGQLTCIDGALVMTDRLQPLSFGSTLNAPEWKCEVLTGPDVLYNQLSTVDRTKKGTRHNSALDFVGSCPKSIAFVISQDGLIAGMTKHNDEIIYLWSDCLSQMWEI